MENSNFLINISALYRNVQKYFDKALSQYDMGSGQVTFLFLIHEKEGITMQEVSRYGQVDKGTTTKSIQKLLEQGYIQQRVDENDHRVKRLYTTPKAIEIMNDLYDLRADCKTQLGKNVDFSAFETLLNEVTENSRRFNPVVSYSGIKIGGLQKLSLLDYPGLTSAIIFTAGCGFKCPFCHNRDLVFLRDDFEPYDIEEILQYLEKRKKIIDGVVISGGEPLIQEGIEEFLKEIKRYGYRIKLDTNGYYPQKLKEVVDNGFVDYVAMDLKNTPEKYAETIGLSKEAFVYERIDESKNFLLEGSVDYEFRTTVVKELHKKQDIETIARSIAGARHYYLQPFQEGENVIQKGFSSYDRAELEEILEVTKVYVPNAQLRGVKNV